MMFLVTVYWINRSGTRFADYHRFAREEDARAEASRLTAPPVREPRIHSAVITVEETGDEIEVYAGGRVHPRGLGKGR